MPATVIHQTDLFLPPADPDDHYDLATQFGLASAGAINLDAILLDAPPATHPNASPAVASIAQLSIGTGIAAPLIVGRQRDATGAASTGRGARFLLERLSRASEPVDVHVVGSCRDVAEAVAEDRALFERKCRRLYLNAGSSSPVPDEPGNREYNIEMDASAYVSMFDLPCPTYWMPCFTITGDRVVSEYATHWSFEQADLLAQLPAALDTYFRFAFSPQVDWWAPLTGRKNLPPAPAERRSMWCTAGFFDSAGLTVAPDGSVQESDRPGVFEFIDADWEVSETGHVSWRATSNPTGRKIFRVTETHNYERAMTQALTRTLSDLGRLMEDVIEQ